MRKLQNKIKNLKVGKKLQMSYMTILVAFVLAIVVD